MKILLITDLYPVYEGQKGISKTIEAFALAWSELGHKVTILRPDFVINTLIRRRKIKKNGIYFNNGIKIYNKNCLLPYVNKVPDEDFDIIISHMPAGNICAYILSKKYKKPHILALHSSDIKVLQDFKYKPFAYILKKALDNAAGISARSHWIKEKIKKYTANDVFLVPSGIKKENLNFNFNYWQNQKIQILCACSLIKRKNVHSLILAAAGLKSIKLKIAGGGPEERKLKKLAKKCGADVEFLGQKTQKEVLELMNKSQIFILPSLNETFGMVYLEALSQGCITVCPKNSGMSGFIKDGENGFLCGTDFCSIKQTIEKIAALSEDEAVHIALKGFKCAKDMEYYKCAKNYIENAKNSVNKKMFKL